MFKKILFIGLFILSFNNIILTQVTQEWVQRYNGPGNYVDGATSIAVDGTGYIYITGYSTGTGTDYDYTTIKYNSSGVQQWIQRYNRYDSTDLAYDLAIDGAGNVYVSGYSYDNATSDDYATIKYNSLGIQQWVQRYNGPGNANDRASSITVDGAGNVYVTGQSTGSGTGYDYSTIKYNSNGIQQWIQRYNGPGNNVDYASSVAVDEAGNVYVTGFSDGGFYGSRDDYATIKYNSAGVQQWVQRYNGPGNSYDNAYRLKIDLLGNVYVTGRSTGSETGYDYATIKYNAAGVLQWVQRYNELGFFYSEDVATSIALDGAGNVYVTGYSPGIGTGSDYVTIKYNSSGVQQWIQRYNGPGNGPDNAYRLKIDLLGNVYVTGSSRSSGTSFDYATIKYNSSGVQQWIQRYNGPGNYTNQPYSIAVDDAGNVYVTGRSDGSGTSFDYATIKYSQNTGIRKISGKIPENFILHQNYPNPFNPATNIRFEIPKAQNVKLTIFDLLGKEVRILVNEYLKSGVYETQFDASDISSGTYIYKLVTKDFMDVKRLVVIK